MARASNGGGACRVSGRKRARRRMGAISSLEVVGLGPSLGLSLHFAPMARDPFSSRTSPSGSKVPHVLAGLLAIALATFAFGFHMPLRAAQRALATAYEEESSAHAATREQLAKMTEQLEETQKELKGASSELKAVAAAESAKAEVSVDLNSRLKDKLASSTKKGLVALSRSGDDTVITIDDLQLYRSHDVALHPSGKKLLCTLAKALKAVAGNSEVAVGSHSHEADVSDAALHKSFKTQWDVTAARAAVAVQMMRDCGFGGKGVSAAAFADTQRTDKPAKNSTGELRIVVRPAAS